jgi:endonuclease/exonuclease/phosphatase family metal-dependent hydrolase
MMATHPLHRSEGKSFTVLSPLAIVWWLVAIASVAGAAEPIRLRVLTYNVHHGEGVDGRLDLERIASFIRSAEPDLVALQEVDREVARTGRVDQPGELARLTRMHVAFGANIELQGGEYGNAVLSRFPIVRHANHHLPNVDDGEQRGVLAAEVELPGVAEPLLLLATHLDHRRPDAERLASATAINDLAAKSPRGRPALLAGDLNDTPDSETLARLATAWTRANPKPLPTVPVKRPDRQIDYVLLRPPERWKVVEVRVLEETVASDHRALLAVLELLPVE